MLRIGDPEVQVARHARVIVERRRRLPAGNDSRMVCDERHQEEQPPRNDDRRRDQRIGNRMCARVMWPLPAADARRRRRCAGLTSGSLDRAGALARLVGRPAGRAGLLHDRLEHFRLGVEHGLDRLVAQHDALEGVEVDLVELAALGAEADRAAARRPRPWRSASAAMPSASSFTPGARSAGRSAFDHREEADLGARSRAASRAWSGARSRATAPARLGAPLAIARPAITGM